MYIKLPIGLPLPPLIPFPTLNSASPPLLALPLLIFVASPRGHPCKDLRTSSSPSNPVPKSNERRAARERERSPRRPQPPPPTGKVNTYIRINHTGDSGAGWVTLPPAPGVRARAGHRGLAVKISDR